MGPPFCRAGKLVNARKAAEVKMPVLRNGRGNGKRKRWRMEEVALVGRLCGGTMWMLLGVAGVSASVN